jgi:5-methylcytosine-specific restriction endonuclease McrA
VNEKQCRAVVKERSQLRCEYCGHSAFEMHHRKNRSQSGQWTPANILHLCRECHRWATEHPTLANVFGLSLKSYEEPTEVAVLTARGALVLADDGSTDFQPLGAA